MIAFLRMSLFIPVVSQHVFIACHVLQEFPFRGLSCSSHDFRLLTMLGWFSVNDKHQLFRNPAVGVNVFHICLDVLHILDLGIAQHVAGSTIFLLVFDTGLRCSVDDKLTFVWGKLVAAYEALGTTAGERIPHAVFMAMFDKRRGYYPTSPPELHSKAAVARHIIAALDYVVRRMGAWSQAGGGFAGDDDGTLRGMVAMLCTNFALFYNCIAYHGQWMPSQAAEEAHDALLATGCAHQALCNRFMSLGRKLFHVTEKAHYAQHIALDIKTTRYNPRFGWTYQDEDYMGKIAQVARACTASRGALRLSGAFAFRYRNRMHLLWAKRRAAIGEGPRDASSL